MISGVVMRTCVVNMAGLAVFAVAAACAGVAEQGWCGALIFQLVILFLCNEAWYRCMKGGALVSTLFGVASKKAEARPAAVEGKVYVHYAPAGGKYVCAGHG